VLQSDNTVVVVVDVQEKLAGVMSERERLVDSLDRLVRGVRVLGLPVIWLEQNPARLGPTVPEVAAGLQGLVPIAKMSFSCCDSGEFSRALEASGRRQVLIAGIEAHICIAMTTLDLLARGYEVHVVSDAVSSRTEANRVLALARMRGAGAVVTGVEMALYELLRVAEGDKFKAILKIVK
jgi:nicotinamidase-related amidase